jgi:hypothetical protein
MTEPRFQEQILSGENLVGEVSNCLVGWHFIFPSRGSSFATFICLADSPENSPFLTGHSGREGTTRWSVVRDQTAGGGRSPVLGLIKCVSWCWKKGRSQKLQYHNWGMMNIHLPAILVFTRSHHILIYNYSWWLSAFLLVRFFWARYTTFSAGFNILCQSVWCDLICIEYGVYNSNNNR